MVLAVHRKLTILFKHRTGVKSWRNLCVLHRVGLLRWLKFEGDLLRRIKL